MERSSSTSSSRTDDSVSSWLSTDTLGSLAAAALSDAPETEAPRRFDPRRSTFAFDRRLYDDADLEVTPSVVVVGARRRSPFAPREVPVQDIQRVCRDFDSPVPAPRRRGRRLRRKRAPEHCLILVIRDGYPVRVPVAADDPNEAYHAVRKAMATEY